MSARNEPPIVAGSLRAWAAEAEAAAGIARVLAPTAFVPESLKRWVTDEQGERIGLDLDATIATVTAALLAGQELGLGPMASLRSIDVVRGTPVLRAHALRGLLLQRGHEIAVVESTGTRATVRARRAGSETVQSSTWTIDRARQLGVAGGDNYRRQAQSMLVARATAEASRWVAADAILGLPYIAEELDGLANGSDPLALDAAGEPEPPPRRAARRAVRSLALPSAPLPEAQPAAPPPRKLTKTQSDQMHAAFERLGIQRDDAFALIRGWTGRTVESTKELLRDEAVKVLDGLRELEAKTERERQDADAERAAPDAEATE